MRASDSTYEGLRSVEKAFTKDAYYRAEHRAVLLGYIPLAVGEWSDDIPIYLTPRDSAAAGYDPFERSIGISSSIPYHELVNEFSDLLRHELVHARDELGDPIGRLFNKENEETLKQLAGACVEVKLPDAVWARRSGKRNRDASAFAPYVLRSPAYQMVLQTHGLSGKRAHAFTIAALRLADVTDANFLMNFPWGGKEAAEVGRKAYFNAETELRAHVAQIVQILIETPTVVRAASEGSLRGADLARLIQENRFYQAFSAHLTEASKAAFFHAVGKEFASRVRAKKGVCERSERLLEARLSPSQCTKLKMLEKLYYEDPERGLAIAERMLKKGEDVLVLQALRALIESQAKARKLLGELDDIMKQPK